MLPLSSPIRTRVGRGSAQGHAGVGKSAAAYSTQRQAVRVRGGGVAARASQEGGGGPDKELESMFSKELKRRGLDSLDDVGSWQPKEEATSASAATSKSPFATKTNPRTAQAGAPQAEGDQRQRSIALVNEGLEGLIPRATELLKLGGSVFLAFAPFILAISLLFSGIYVAFGDNFVHGGDRGALPAYVDPETLLSEPTVDPYIPFN